ncbi:Glycogen synthase, ADP-glucose transglucosylase [hydrothermal vent metagenome]|uniref:starch synthase n=1 Tax=hydrothermal vent metagenome TaxID=652676 RepID=A0A3B0R9N6_9ZZZZ
MGLNVVIAASEILPFAKTGGLADVIGALPGALRGEGVETTLFMPLYREVREGGNTSGAGSGNIKPTGITINVPIGKRVVVAELYKDSLGAATIYFLRCDEYFDRSFLYGTQEGAYFDNLERFTLFSRGVIEAVMMLGINPDVIHCSDWQTGLIPAYMKTLYGSVFSNTATVFTIHNMAFQGIFPTSFYDITGLPYSAYNPEGLEYWGQINLLKAGIVYSDIITTVSETYSREIQTKEQGCGLQGVLAGRSEELFGILNGVDYDIWNPEKDEFIAANYSSKDLKGKAACKKALIKEYGLKVKQGEPLIGIISRLTDQKGFDIVAEATAALMEMGLGIVILGSGERKYQELMLELAKTYKGRLGVKISFDNALSHRIEAGADFFLMPSRFEPCGLNQFYSLRYGTIPVVRATGGLDDSIIDYKPPGAGSSSARGNGFKFKRYTAKALTGKVAEAIELFKDKKAIKALRVKAMTEDFSWKRSAARYLELYELAIAKVRG